MSRIFKKCARLYPHERQCRICPHHNCSLRDLNNPFEADTNEEKAVSSFNDDNRDRIKSSWFLNPEEAI